MFDINGWEVIVLAIVGILVLGPERLPEYAAKLADLVRQVRGLAQNARTQLKEQMGPDFDDVDWKQYDPRQYDPRRIVREALMDEPSPSDEPVEPMDKPQSGSMAPVPQPLHDSAKPTPWDADAT
ncbi:twin-arginine translocase TatA/TatE family subunit [Lapillicoccus sp.]|uniref:twin-arginine translocase TatA/TatE family subunit n=1 Tax=Lapillicoccus sp. TaxID=1909287 RepID=UPI003264F7C3